MVTKICRICGKEGQIEEFARDKRCKDGVYNTCKECVRMQERARYAQNPVRKREQVLRSYRKTGRDVRRARYAQNPELRARRSEERRQIYWKNPEHNRELKRRAYARNAERYREEVKLRRAANPERAREIRRREYKKHQNAYIEHARRRRALKAGRTQHFTQVEWRALKAEYNYTCPCCGRSEPDIKLAFDHVVPLSKGGADTIDNIQPLCKSCNSRKGTKSTDYRKSTDEMQD